MNQNQNNTLLNDVLSDTEIEDITGTKQRKKQASILEKHGVFFFTRRDGEIRTTWFHIHHPLIHQQSSNDEPNFEAIK